MKISIAMATYNGAPYIEPLLDSLRLQTKPADEVIICDDQSTDNTVEIVKNYIGRFHLEENWNLYVNEMNLGYADNFHSAMRMCTGDIIFFCDQDDIWRLNKLEVMTDVMVQNQKVGILYSDFQNFDTNAEIKKPSLTVCSDISIKKVGLNKDNIYLHTIGCAMAICKETLNMMDKYWYPGFAHDEFIWKMGLSFGNMFYVSTVLLDRRCHGRNVSMGKMRSLKKRIDYVENLEKSFCVMKECLLDQQKNYVDELKLVLHNILGCQLRLKVLKKRQVWYLPRLLIAYGDTVKTRKTLLIETFYAMRINNNGEY